MSGNWRNTGSSEDRSPPGIGEVVDRWLTAEGLTELKSLEKIRTSWSATVGEEIAIHAAPIGLRDGKLLIAVDHSAWATELKFLEARIRREVAVQLAGDVVTRVEVRVRPPGGVE